MIKNAISLTSPIQRNGSTLAGFINKRIAWFLLAPSFLFFTVFWFVPTVASFGISFYYWNGVDFAEAEWVGLENYLYMLEDFNFSGVFFNTFYVTFIAMVILPPLSLILAIVVDSGIKANSFFTAIFFLPTVLSMIVVGYLFTLILSPTYGFSDAVMGLLGLDHLIQYDWLGHKSTAMNSIIAVYIWKSFGFYVLLYIAGLKNVPREQVEAAKIDGASTLQTIWHVVIPHLREITYVVLILVFTNTFLLFDMIIVMTEGGPFYATDVMGTYMYQQAFSGGKTEMGYASSIAIVMLIINLSFVGLLSKFRQRT